jgi:hypothetical protein
VYPSGECTRRYHALCADHRVRLTQAPELHSRAVVPAVDSAAVEFGRKRASRGSVGLGLLARLALVRARLIGTRGFVRLVGLLRRIGLFGLLWRVGLLRRVGLFGLLWRVGLL